MRSIIRHSNKCAVIFVLPNRGVLCINGQSPSWICLSLLLNGYKKDPSLPPFPQFECDCLVGFLDTAHATELKTRRSVTGYAILFCCAAIAWKGHVQPVAATSSTEAEFYASVTCTKTAKYLHYVLEELDVLRPGPTP